MTADEQAIRMWFATLAKCVNSTDFTTGRTLFADDIVSFGTWTTLMYGLEHYATQQWANVWPNVQNFRFHDDMYIRIVGDTAWAVATWDSEGIEADGAAFDRPGRTTMIFEKRGSKWLGVHSHFSLYPKTALKA